MTYTSLSVISISFQAESVFPAKQYIWKSNLKLIEDIIADNKQKSKCYFHKHFLIFYENIAILFKTENG